MSAVRNMDQMEVLVLLLIFGNIRTKCYIPLAAEIHDGMQRARVSKKAWYRCWLDFSLYPKYCEWEILLNVDFEVSCGQQPDGTHLQ